MDADWFLSYVLNKMISTDYTKGVRTQLMIKLGRLGVNLLFVPALLIGALLYYPAIHCSSALLWAEDGDEEAYFEEGEAAAEEDQSNQWSQRLLDIVVEDVNGQPAVKLKTTGQVKTSISYLTKPHRMLMKVRNTLLTWKPPRVTVNQSPLYRIRAAQHDADVWVVLDLTDNVKWNRQTHQQGITLTLRESTSAQKKKVVKKEERGETTFNKKVDRYTPVQSKPIQNVSIHSTQIAAGYQVVDVAAENLGSKTKLVITTDGLAKYRVAREKNGRGLNVQVHGAALTWSGKLKNSPIGAIKSVSAKQQVSAGQPTVALNVVMTRPSPYVVFKDQNQIIIEFNNPDVISGQGQRRGNLKALVSVDLENAELVSVLRALAQDVKFDLVLTPGSQKLDPSQSVLTLTINEQPFDQVMDFILRPRKMAYDVSGNTLRVGLADEFAAETRVFTMKNLDVKNSNIKESIEMSVTDNAKSKIVLDPYGNRVIVSAIPSDMKRISEVISRMDVQRRLVTRTFSLNYTQASKVVPFLKERLSSLGSVKENKAENSMMITDIPGNMSALAQIINGLDIKAQQVMIEARIVEVSRSNQQEIGVNWTARGGSDPSFTASTSPDAVNRTGQLTIGTLQAGINLNATLAAMESKGMVNTISNPRIATLNNEEASLNASQSIPYITSVVSNGVVSQGVEYLELPISLKVKPQITKGEQVLLDPLTLTVTTPVGDATPPRTTTRSATTQMLVRDGETVAIGGMVRDEEITRESKVPLLGDLPLLGFLFRSNVTQKNKVELVVFLTPHILE